MALYPDYATSLELKHYLRIPDGGEDTDDDAELALALTAASRAIDKATNRQFGLNGSAVARVYTPEYDYNRGRYVAQIFDLMTVSGLVVKTDLGDDGIYENTISSSNYRLTPVNASGDGRPWTDLIFEPEALVTVKPYSLEVTANWGWTTVPSTIENACLLQASRLFKRRDAPFGVLGSPEMGNMTRLLPKLDPDVEQLVMQYRRWWSAA